MEPNFQINNWATLKTFKCKWRNFKKNLHHSVLPAASIRPKCRIGIRDETTYKWKIYGEITRHKGRASSVINHESSLPRRAILNPYKWHSIYHFKYCCTDKERVIQNKMCSLVNKTKWPCNINELVFCAASLTDISPRTMFIYRVSQWWKGELVCGTVRKPVYHSQTRSIANGQESILTQQFTLLWLIHKDNLQHMSNGSVCSGTCVCSSTDILDGISFADLLTLNLF